MVERETLANIARGESAAIKMQIQSAAKMATLPVSDGLASDSVAAVLPRVKRADGTSASAEATKKNAP